jgi:hypothetical protein
MVYEEALALSSLVNVMMPWIDAIYAFPVRPREQHFGQGPYLLSLSSGFLRLALYEPEEWAAIVRQLPSVPGPSGFPLLEREVFDQWIVEQLTRTDLSEEEQHCGHGELAVYVLDPDNNAARALVASRSTMAPVVEGGALVQDTALPVVPEIMLTVAWACPVCSLPLTFTRRMRAEPGPEGEYRLFAGSIHQAQGTEKRCPASVWVEIDYCEQDDPQFDPLEVKVWQIVPKDAYLAAGGKEEA